MKFRDLLPPAFARAFDGFIGKSLATDFASGRDLDGGGLGSEARLSLPYAQSAWVQSAIRFKTSEIAATALKFYAGENELADKAVLAWWESPFIGPARRALSQAEGRAALAAWLDLEGECFILLGDEWLLPSFSRRGAPLPKLLIARPDRMRHITSGAEIVGWMFTDGAGRQHALLPEQVKHRAEFNPYDEWRGLSRLLAVFNAAESDYLAGVYTRNLMRNNGDQGVFIGVKGQPPTDAQRDQIIGQLREKRRRAQRGEFSAAFIPAEILVEDAKASAPGADIQASRIASREEIFVGLGVPPSMGQVKASYSTGASSDRYQLITGTCMAQAKAVDDLLGQIASMQTGLVLTAEADWDDHPVMVEARQARVDSALKLWGAGMPLKDANDYLGLGMRPFTGWEIGYLPFSVSPVDAMGGTADPAADPALAEPAADVPADPAVEQLRLVLLARQRIERNVTPSRPVARRVEAGDPFAAFVCQCHGEGLEMKERDPKQLARWKDLMAKRRETVRSYEARFGREIMAARREVLAKIERSYTPAAKGVVAKAAAADLIFDLGKWKDGFLASMRRVAATALNTAGKQLFAELGKDDPFAFPPEAVLEYARSRENKLSGVADEVHARITESLESGITAGDTTEELAARIRAEFNGIDAGRARVIAMTETSAAYGQGRQQAMQEAGIEYKQWLTSGNANVRATHAAANEQIVPVDEYFDVGGEQLAHPGDPAGSPENVINCHCVSIPVETAEG